MPILRPRPTQVCISINPQAVPALPGALECIAAGHLSSLHPQNVRAVAVAAGAERLQPGQTELLTDPQTAGGLLAGVPLELADQCIERLKAEGYEGAAIIGRVVEVVPEAGAADGKWIVIE